jgi:hypothetical protein
MIFNYIESKKNGFMDDIFLDHRAIKSHIHSISPIDVSSTSYTTVRPNTSIVGYYSLYSLGAVILA